MNNTHTGTIRRNPRNERANRNRLHPQHIQLSLSASDVRGPNGLIRRNPHTVSFVGPNGIKRIDRLMANAAPITPQRRVSKENQHYQQLPLIMISDPEYYIVVVLDMVGGRLTNHDKDSLGQGQKLVSASETAGAVVAVVFGETKEESFEYAGADRVIRIRDITFSGYSPEQRVLALHTIEKTLKPRYWLFPDSVSGGNDLGCRLAASLGERPATNVWQMDLQHCTCRGGSQQTDIVRKTPRILLLAEECADPVDEYRHQALILNIENIPTSLTAIEDMGSVLVDPNQIALDEAEFIIAAGNGVRDWNQFHHAAKLLRATQGASRVVVDDGLMPRSRQVGATGTWVTARVYIAIGISGAIQHMQGIDQCDKVVAINLDSHCDMVKRADLSVIGDSQEILAELLNLLEQRRGSENAA